MSRVEIPTLFVHWETFLGWLLDHTERFPRAVRFTLTQRIENRAIDVYERIAEARFARERSALLHTVNNDLEILRLLLRLAHARRCLDTRAYAYACEAIDTAGRMVGGWLRHQKQCSPGGDGGGQGAIERSGGGRRP